MPLQMPERRPKEHIEDIRDRFMDFVGNPWNGILGTYDNLGEKGFSPEALARSREQLKGSWQRFFENIETFLTRGFEPSGNITRENLEVLLAHRNDDPFASGVVENVDRLYRSTVGLVE